MFVGICPCDISVEFGNVLLALSLGAITVFLVIVYIEEIAAGLCGLLRSLNSWALSARFRIGWLLHRVTH